MRTITIILITLLLVGTLAVPAKAASYIKVTVDEIPIQMDVPPVNIDGRILVPLRAIFEALGADIDRNSSTKTVIRQYEKQNGVLINEN